MRVGKDIDPALLDALVRMGLDSVEGAFAFRGGEDLIKENLGHRRRTRFTLTDESGCAHELYLKRYEREDLSDRLKRWWTYGVRTSPAEVEFDNIEAISASGIPTMQAVICGQQWGLLDAKRSYLIVTAVPGCKLEKCVSQFLDDNAEKPEVLWTFTLSLANLVRKVHEAGYVHRDLYTAHIFLNELDDRMEMHLIDLGRVFEPKCRKFRWRVKDLAQLKYSMPRTRWAEKYWDPFMQHYLGEPDGRTLRQWNRWIGAKAARMHRRRYRKQNQGES